MGYDLKDKVVLITGASAGIGKCCAFQLAEKGAKLALVARSEEALQELSRTIGGDCIGIRADVRNKEEIEAAIQRAGEHFGRLDVLINNAGVGLRGSIIKAPMEHVNTLVSTNLMGVVYVIRAAYPIMQKQGGGMIVNVSSIAGLKGFHNSGLYSATKFAVAGLTESLSQEGEGDNIKTVLVCPGKTDSDFEDNLLYNGDPDFKNKNMVSSDKVAKAMINGIIKQKKLVIVGKWCRTLYVLNRISMGFTNFLLKVMYR